MNFPSWLHFLRYEAKCNVWSSQHEIQRPSLMRWQENEVRERCGFNFSMPSAIYKHKVQVMPVLSSAVWRRFSIFYIYILDRDVVKLDWKIQQQRKMLILTLKSHSCFSFTYFHGRGQIGAIHSNVCSSELHMRERTAIKIMHVNV
jgi:hypothetical protein